ncbi:LPXTG cell wall anchor domain-containing protein [Vitellibacter sp. q18]|jgi:LPXTG-motif cell wall-anchored protein|nr:LPXTG cell wall anchor domain-containing protein [Aequorivita lutea]
MIKILGFILTIAGGIGLVMGVLGAFGNMSTGINAWALIILGIVFFIAGIGLLKNRKDTDQT